MKKQKLLTALAVFGASLATLLVVNTGAAFAATATWTGGGSDTNMDTAGNWGGTAPSAGDDLVFPSGVTNRTVVNNYSAATSFNSITFSGTNTTNNDYTVSGNSMTVVAGITNAMSGGANSTISAPLILDTAQNIAVPSSSTTLKLSGVVSGSGALTKTGVGSLSLAGNNTFTGVMNVASGILSSNTPTGLGSTAAGTVVANGALLNILMADIANKNVTIGEDLVINGSTYTNPSASYQMGSLAVNVDCGLSYCSDGNITLSGAVTLGADISITTYQTVTLSGAISGAHTLALYKGITGKVIVSSSNNTSQTPNGTYVAPVVTTTYSSNLPTTQLNVGFNEIAIVTGTYGQTYVNTGAF